MNFSCKLAETNSMSEIFYFDWTINLYDVASNSTLASKEFASTFNDGTNFQIIVLKESQTLDRYNGSYKNNTYVGLRRTGKKMCDVKALLLFEIRNCSGQLYLKESLETQFTTFNEEHLTSDAFEFPSSNREMQGRKGKIYFQGSLFVIKGKVCILCYQNKEVSEPLNENTCQLQSDLKDLLQNKLYADVAFHIGDDVLHAHKNILCSRSEVFKKMFERNMKEKEVNSVDITDIEKPVFETFLIFLYTGTVPDKKIDVVMPLYSVADKYALKSLFNTCSSILISYISDKTVAPILKVADMHNDASLKATAIDFICRNFVKIEGTNSWDALLNSDPRLASYALKQVSKYAAK